MCLAELATDYMCVAHVAVAGLLWRLGKRRRPLLLCSVFAVCLLRWPACRPAAMLCSYALHNVQHGSYRTV